MAAEWLRSIQRKSINPALFLALFQILFVKPNLVSKVCTQFN